MAPTPLSCSNHSPSSLIPYPINFSSKPLNHCHPLAILYFPKSFSSLDLVHGLTVERPNEAVPIDKKSFVIETNYEDITNNIEITRKKLELDLRRRKRRKRRRGSLECIDMVKEDKVLQFRTVKTGSRLTQMEESECIRCLNEEARIDALRKRVEGTSGIELNPSQLAKAAGMSRRRLDKLLVDAKESQDRIIRSYRGLVASVAASYQCKGFSLQDRIQAGSIGLLRGAKKFNSKKGCKLSTYACWWIRVAITRAMSNNSRIIRLPHHLAELVPKVCDANTKLTSKLLRKPSYEEIAEVLDMDIATVRLVMEKNLPPISLDGIQTSKGIMSLQHIIAGPKDLTPEEMLRKQMKKQELEKFIDSVLSDREAKVLKLRFGLNGDAPQSFEEIGKAFKLSHSRIRQINREALSKLRESRMLDNLKYYL